MAEYIDRATLLQFISETREENAYCVQVLFEKMLQDAKGLPAADVVERKKGKWESIPGEIRIERFTCCPCSECGWIEPHGNFCRHCGADMRGET